MALSLPGSNKAIVLVEVGVLRSCVVVVLYANTAKSEDWTWVKLGEIMQLSYFVAF